MSQQLLRSVFQNDVTLASFCFTESGERSRKRRFLRRHDRVTQRRRGHAENIVKCKKVLNCEMNIGVVWSRKRPSFLWDNSLMRH